MRVAQVTYSYSPVRGGADVYALTLHRALEAAGHESLVWQGWTEGAGGPEARAIPETALSRLGRGRFWTLPLGLRAARRDLAACDVLIAHYANYHQPLRWHPHTILLSHGVWWDDRPGAARSRIKRAITRAAFDHATAVVANDTFFLRDMGLDIKPGATPHTEVLPGRHYLPNAVDLERFHPEGRPALNPRAPLILVPRNLYENRGVHLAIEAMAAIRRDRPATMRIAGGDGQPTYAARCRRLTTDLGLDDAVTFAGAIPWERMPEEYRRADLALVPTLCGEGTSLAALEAMACGAPCVATAVAGLQDLPATLCEPTAAAIATTCLEALDTGAELAHQQLEAVRQDFSLDRWTTTWLRVIEQTAAR